VELDVEVVEFDVEFVVDVLSVAVVFCFLFDLSFTVLCVRLFVPFVWIAGNVGTADFGTVVKKSVMTGKIGGECTVDERVDARVDV
jgi:hypothetical protein